MSTNFCRSPIKKRISFRGMITGFTSTKVSVWLVWMKWTGYWYSLSSLRKGCQLVRVVLTMSSFQLASLWWVYKKDEQGAWAIVYDEEMECYLNHVNRGGEGCTGHLYVVWVQNNRTPTRLRCSHHVKRWLAMNMPTPDLSVNQRDASSAWNMGYVLDWLRRHVEILGHMKCDGFVTLTTQLRYGLGYWGRRKDWADANKEQWTDWRWSQLEVDDMVSSRVFMDMYVHW